MAVETDADRAIFFHEDDFGVVATVTPAGGSPGPVNGILLQPSDTLEGAGGLPFTSDSPAFRCRASDVATVAAATPSAVSTLVAGSETYEVHDVEPDGDGMTVLILRRPAP